MNMFSYLCSRIERGDFLTLPYGVMVAHQILVLLVWVRILVGQQSEKPAK